MSDVPAGWYLDPSPAPGDTPRERYWDGVSWSRHVRQPEATDAVRPGPTPDGVYEGPASIPTTPDGQALAGWLPRAAAVALDVLVMVPLLLAAALPSLVTHWNSIADWWNASESNQRLVTETSVPNPPVFDPSTTPGLVLAGSLFAVSIAYSVVFLRWKQATPGKLRVGLRVRRRSAPGPLSWWVILRRVGFVAALGVAAQAPVVGVPFLVLGILDYLWPLWDKDNQALHDKVAGTNVVLAQGRIR